MNSTLPASVDFDGASLTIIDRDAAPWISAVDLARALGYKRSDAIARIHQRNFGEFAEGMSLTVKLTPTPARIFSPRGCHLVAMFANTPRAARFRRWVLDVLEGLAPPRIQDQSQAALQAMRERRWCLTFTDAGTPRLTAIVDGAVMVRPDQMAGLIADPGSVFDRTHLPEIIAAAARRLGARN